MKMIGIYKITNLINGYCYIGQSVDINRRFTEHKNLNKKGSMLLHRAFKKYGLCNFRFEVVEECPVDELDEKEVFYISKMKPEYNIADGGQGASGHHVSDEIKKILSDHAKRQWENMSDEEKNKRIVNNLKGPKLHHIVSSETRLKLRNANLGKKQSAETVEKRNLTIEKLKENGYKQTNQGHCKKVICIETGEVYASVKEAGKQMNVHPSSISGVLKGRYNTCKGKHFEYFGGFDEIL